jgi:BMFP domain-containing protein YqiC
VKASDENLINALKKTISQLEAKKNPVQSAAAAKKKAVNNIQKALTKKILTRLDDT